MIIKEMLKKIIFGEKATSESYVKFLRKKGITIGEDVTIFAPTKTLIDIQYPWMIEIGNNVNITEGVKIITHDYSWSVMKKNMGEYEGAVLGASGKISIGDNVFIGLNSIILRGVSIGDNCIIGAGSVVVKNCESNCVYAGNPAKKIMTLEEFTRKRIAAQIEEAKELVLSYFKRYKKIPEKEVLNEYFMLFEANPSLIEKYKKQMMLCGNYEKSVLFSEKYKRQFKNYDEFIEFCFQKEG